VEEGIRIGPRELNAETKFLASGYWDDDPYKDLCVAISIIGDTSYTRTSIWRYVVFWGQPDGVYTLEDTTRLVVVTEINFGAYSAASADLDGSGTESLLIYGGGAIDNVIIPTAELHIFRHSGTRWGRSGVSRRPAWSWWNHPKIKQIQLVDQDYDGHTDIAMHYYVDGATRGEVSVLYGNGNGLPDTTEVEHLDLTVNNGAVSLFGDLTGDGVPELWVNSGSENILRVYAGRRGQRLAEQYGTGNEGVSEGKGWWRRPWAEIWLSAKLDDGWGISGFARMFDLGDCNLDGVPDYWMRHEPTIISYVAGNAFDSLIDAVIVWPGNAFTGVVNLGEIDGSGKQTIALSYDYLPHAYQDAFPGGVVFVQGTTDVPVTGWYRATPDEASGVVGERVISGGLNARAEPNPGSGEVRISWSRTTAHGDMELCISDVLGREVLSRRVPGSDGGMIWPTSGLVPGLYWIGIHDDDHSATIKFLVR